ncbi:MAG: hypothetical protein HC886_19055 [Leptolyngbyaceae cyanobacterium SM1_1_3]|nr:hypothetical protein [Leptolyngbyaceae cyanobacterium SM1_1_3]NJN04618.1 hypothetical protein [Leptolyngbyaceae cyanobacterium RM1_1_2]NJO11036.1 hypothetical protein [Leptolyngbyaceae cyanobacterium SL_1_1]
MRQPVFYGIAVDWTNGEKLSLAQFGIVKQMGEHCGLFDRTSIALGDEFATVVQSKAKDFVHYLILPVRLS